MGRLTNPLSPDNIYLEKGSGTGDLDSAVADVLKLKPRATTAPVTNLSYGNQNGYMPKPQEYIASASFVQSDVICLLVEAPLGFEYFENPKECRTILKTLVEESAKTIEGLNSTLTVETVDTPIGATSEVHQDIARVTRARTEPVFTFSERMGRAVASFHELWITMLGLTPETSKPGIINFNTNVKPEMFTPAFKSMTCLFIEPDVSFSRVIRSWLVHNMFPLSSGDITGRRDQQTGGSNIDLSITYSGVTQVGYHVTQFAQQQLSRLRLIGNHPDECEPYLDARKSNIESIDRGYIESIL